MRLLSTPTRQKVGKKIRDSASAEPKEMIIVSVPAVARTSGGMNVGAVGGGSKK